MLLPITEANQTTPCKNDATYVLLHHPTLPNVRGKIKSLLRQQVLRSRAGVIYCRWDTDGTSFPFSYTFFILALEVGARRYYLPIVLRLIRLAAVTPTSPIR